MAVSLWDFPHDAGWGEQIMQIVAGLFLWATFTYGGLKIILMFYESGKGEEHDREIERDIDTRFPSPIGWYRRIFCFRIAVSLAFIVEGIRFGQGRTSLALICLGVASWFLLSPKRKWMK